MDAINKMISTAEYVTAPDANGCCTYTTGDEKYEVDEYPNTNTTAQERFLTSVFKYARINYGSSGGEKYVCVLRDPTLNLVGVGGDGKNMYVAREKLTHEWQTLDSVPVCGCGRTHHQGCVYGVGMRGYCCVTPVYWGGGV
eukprot:GDKI01010789.1.p1 GENE.GDKI01010789.1~~GDKI01010789.1.p1  ORF type:complete len:141 (-),score=51.65 GDKI01010789.1:121-543(-)